RVSIVEPGSIDTPIWSRGEANAAEILAVSPETERLYGAAIERFREVVRRTAARGIPPERVAKAIVHALESRRPRSRYLVGLDAKLQARIVPLIPTPLLDRAIGSQLGLR
ncbi:MAG TPA: retinol dehydrogenase, partial [Solirubrobacterales bacterium]